MAAPVAVAIVTTADHGMARRSGLKQTASPSARRLEDQTVTREEKELS